MEIRKKRMKNLLMTSLPPKVWKAVLGGRWNIMKERLNGLPKEELIDLLEDLTMRVPGAMNFIVHGVENSSED